MTLQQIIEDMEQQITECETRNEPRNEASFGTGIGVIVSWGDAKSIVNALKSITPEFTSASTPTYEWTLDDSELPVNKGDVMATQQYLDDRLAEMEEKIIYFIKNPQS